MFCVVLGSTVRADLQSIVDQKCTQSEVGLGGAGFVRGENYIALHIKDATVQLTSQSAVQVASPFAAGAQVQCRLLAACIRGAVDGLTSTPFLYYKKLNGTVQVHSRFDW